MSNLCPHCPQYRRLPILIICFTALVTRLAKLCVWVSANGMNTKQSKPQRMQVATKTKRVQVTMSIHGITSGRWSPAEKEEIFKVSLTKVSRYFDALTSVIKIIHLELSTAVREALWSHIFTLILLSPYIANFTEYHRSANKIGISRPEICNYCLHKETLYIFLLRDFWVLERRNV